MPGRRALSALNQGQDPEEVVRWLGLKWGVLPLPPFPAFLGIPAVVWSDEHAAYAAGGKIDKYGEVSPYRGDDTHGDPIRGGYVVF